MFKDLTVNEMKKLEEYVKSISTTNQDNSITLQRRHVPVWAFISWQPAPLNS
jgi:hypothetical protein